MAENIVKVFKFPGSEVGYTVNATHLDGEAGSSIRNRITTLEADVAALENFDALRYMGTITAVKSTTPIVGALTQAASKGDVYKVILPSDADEETYDYYVMGAKVEAGDMLICNTDNTAAATSSNYATIAANWDIVQTNVDVEAILAHTHTISTETKSIDHNHTFTKANITGTFSGGAATVTGNHEHTGSISIDNATAGGTVETTEITPAGTVKLTAPTSAGTNDVTITPTGTVKASTTEYVTSVGVGVDAHPAHNHTGTVDESAAQAVSGSVTIKTGTGTANYTPAGTITVDANTAGGTINSHTHTITVTPSTGTALLSPTYSGSNTEGILTFTNASFVTGVEASASEETLSFTGAPHNHTATFSGTPVQLVATHSLTAAAHSHDLTIDDADAMSHDVVVTAPTTAHAHTFTGDAKYIHAAFTGTKAGHTHTFIGAPHNHTGDVTVDKFTGNFSGSASGNVGVTVTEAENGKVLTNITTANHTITTVKSATTGTGKQ